MKFIIYFGLLNENNFVPQQIFSLNTKLVML
jgi:hypothetical protein